MANNRAWKQAFELQRQSHENELKEAQSANEVLTTALGKAHREAVFYENRVRELNYHINQAPGELASTDALIRAKDNMFSDLERKAGKCYTAFRALEKSSREDRARAKDEMAGLREELAKSRTLVASLGESKNVFQEQCQDLLGMLRKKVYSTDFIRAMDHHYHLMIQDNSNLVSITMDQDQRLTDQGLELQSLQAKTLQLARSLEEQKGQCSDLETALREKDVKIGQLQSELDAQAADHQLAIDSRDALIADLRGQLQEVKNSTTDLLHATREEGERQVILGKDNEISELKQAHMEYTADNRDLRQELLWQEEIIDGNTAAVAQAQHALAEKSAKLLTAEDNLATMEQRIGGQFGLPPTISVLELLSEREEIGQLRQDHELLQTQLELAEVHAEEIRAMYNQRMPKAKELGRELLARLRQAQGAPATSYHTETDEELAEILDQCPTEIGR